MKEERLKEISAFATHRLVTGDILAAYALELAVELHDAERERDQAIEDAAQIRERVAEQSDDLWSYWHEMNEVRYEVKHFDDKAREWGAEIGKLMKKAEQLERERDQANALLSAAHAFHDLAVKERDAERVKNTALRLELESASRNIARLLAAVEKWEALASTVIRATEAGAPSREQE